MTSQKTAIFWTILAAGLYALNAPVSKLLLEEVPPTMMAALLYLGAGIGLAVVCLVQRMTGKGKKEAPLTKKDMPYTVGMVVLDIAAPIFLMVGLTMTTAANASLLNNFEIVATAVIALFIFREAISRPILSVEDVTSFTFSYGSIFVLLACVCWGLENNCTRMISHKDPLEIVVIKGFGSGLGSLVLAFFLGENALPLVYGVCTLLLGFVAYGLSIFFYIYAQRYLGAAKTSAYYALAPFMATALSLVIFREKPSISFFIALLIMAVGTYFASTDNAEEK